MTKQDISTAISTGIVQNDEGQITAKIVKDILDSLVALLPSNDAEGSPATKEIIAGYLSSGANISITEDAGKLVIALDGDLIDEAGVQSIINTHITAGQDITAEVVEGNLKISFSGVIPSQEGILKDIEVSSPLTASYDDTTKKLSITAGGYDTNPAFNNSATLDVVQSTGLYTATAYNEALYDTFNVDEAKFMLPPSSDEEQGILINLYEVDTGFINYVQPGLVAGVYQKNNDGSLHTIIEGAINSVNNPSQRKLFLSLEGAIARGEPIRDINVAQPLYCLRVENKILSRIEVLENDGGGAPGSAYTEIVQVQSVDIDVTTSRRFVDTGFTLPVRDFVVNFGERSSSSTSIILGQWSLIMLSQLSDLDTAEVGAAFNNNNSLNLSYGSPNFYLGHNAAGNLVVSTPNSGFDLLPFSIGYLSAAIGDQGGEDAIARANALAGINEARTAETTANLARTEAAAVKVTADLSLSRTQRLTHITPWTYDGDARTIYLEWKPIRAISSGTSLTIRIEGISKTYTLTEGLAANDSHGLLIPFTATSNDAANILRNAVNSRAGHLLASVEDTSNSTTDYCWIPVVKSMNWTALTGDSPYTISSHYTEFMVEYGVSASSVFTTFVGRVQIPSTAKTFLHDTERPDGEHAAELGVNLTLNNNTLTATVRQQDGSRGAVSIQKIYAR